MKKPKPLITQFEKYFKKYWHTELKLEAKDSSHVVIVHRWDGAEIEFEPLSFVELFDTALNFCKEKERPWLKIK